MSFSMYVSCTTPQRLYQYRNKSPEKKHSSANIFDYTKIDKYIYMLWAELKFSQILNLTDCLGKFEICLVKKSVKFEICPESSGKFEI